MARIISSGKCSSTVLPVNVIRYVLLLLAVSVILYMLITSYNVLDQVEHSVKQFLHHDHSEEMWPGSGSDDSALLVVSNVTQNQTEPVPIRSVLVQTNSGTLRGFVQDVSGNEINTFLSVPFGEPPINELRFRPTQPVKPWSGVRDATQMPPPCIQSEYTQRLFPVRILNENITEDCLFLNIWSPAKRSNELKSVLVLIHGGLFTIGSTSIDEYDGRMLAAYGDVVVVTIQYRLGIFGFLDLDTPQVPGNMGLFDQHTALQWVHDNIEHFGGDKHSITLFGTSAGSISIGFHMFSPKSAPLFKRAILQSGSPMLLKDVYIRGEALAEKFALEVGCYQKTSNSSIYDEPDKVVECLDLVSFDKILQIQNELVKNNPVPFMPTIPSEYIENFINEYNESTPMYQKEVLMGFNQNEGALMLHAAYPEVYTRNTVPQITKLKEVQQKVVEMGIDSGLKPSQASSIASILIRGKEMDTPTKWAQVVADLFSDIMFICPTYEFANKLQSLNITTYLYLFGQRSKNTAWGEWMDVTHHDEIGFIMGYPLRYPQLYSKEDMQISSKMIKTWTNFAKTGNIPQKYYPEVWRPYNQQDKYYMQIKAHHIKIGSNFHDDSCEMYNLMAAYLD